MRRPFVIFLSLAIAELTTTALAFAQNIESQGNDARPNIVLIMADDLGLESLACYGGESHPTPNLDRLAASGMRFVNAHSQPLCTPSRVQLMTGLYNNRNYIRFGVLDPGAVTIGNVLRGAGYDTCIAGKWQLLGGFDGPRRFGFDRYCLWQLNRRPSRYPNPGLEIDGRRVDYRDGEFGPDVVTDYIAEFLAEPRDRPFFVYYPMILPHIPAVPTPDHPDWDPTMWRDATAEPGRENDLRYWDAMVRHTDKMVGKLLDALEANGLRENTLVIWTADNGAHPSITTRFRGQKYRGGKGSTKDNGTHVGFLASMPGVISEASTSETLVDFADIFPTLLELTGAPVPAGVDFDGVSLMPAFRGQPRDKSHIYCWYHRNGVREEASEHTRDARFKLYGDGRFYNVIEDPDEQRDLSVDKLSAESQSRFDVLSTALKQHQEVARRADPIQAVKRGLHP